MYAYTHPILRPLAKGKNYWNGDKIKRVEVTHLPSSGEELHHYSFQLQVAVKMTPHLPGRQSNFRCNA